MKISEFVKKIEKTYPLNYCEEYDNSGLNIGCSNDSITNILVCLDIDINAIEYAINKKCNLIVSHHPLTFNSYKNILDDINSLRIKEVILNNINCYSLHTNFDSLFSSGMANAYIKKLNISNKIKKINILKKNNDNKSGVGFVIEFKKKISINNIYNLFIKKLDIKIDKTQIFSKNSYLLVNKVAVCPGSGRGLNNILLNNNIEVFLSSELSHNDILDLIDNNVSYINLTHYGSEKVFIEYIYKFIKTKYKLNVYKYYNEIM